MSVVRGVVLFIRGPVFCALVPVFCVLVVVFCALVLVFCALVPVIVERDDVFSVRELKTGRIGRSSRISGYEGTLRVGVQPA